MTAAVLLFATAVLCASAALASPAAYAATTDIDASADALQQKVEQATASYVETQEAIEELEAKIADNSARIAEIEAVLPAKRAQSAFALVMLYKLNQEGFSLVEMVFGCGDLRGFLRNAEYVSHVQQKFSADAAEAARMEAELKAKQQELLDAKSEVLARQDEARSALEAAQAAREQAIASSKASAAEGVQQATQAGAQGSAGNAPVPPSDDGVTGTEDRASFIAAWAPRIDAYLSGSPLSGQGAAFAAAAWDYGVDPRFSPAISCVESSKGAYCFLPYNAWGWGSCSWSCWEDAIRDHVAGLARGYGYTVSVAGAQKYCPPNWEFWYNNVSAQMNLI